MTKYKSAAVLVASTTTIPSILLAAGAHPWWTGGEINRYMKQQLEKKGSKPNWAYYLEMPYNYLGAFSLVVAFLSLLATLGLIFGGGAIETIFGLDPVFSTTYALWGFIVGAASFALAFAILVLETGLTVREPAVWSVVPIQDYHGPIPTEVKEFMERLKSMRPDVGFTIYELVQGERDLDPVLASNFPVADGVISFPSLVWEGKSIVPVPATT